MNDAQKTMGIIALALLIFHKIPALYIPIWVKCICTVVIMLGTLYGGRTIIKTMGQKIFKIQPVHGFAAQSATAGVILSASLASAPIRTTQVIASSVLGGWFVAEGFRSSLGSCRGDGRRVVHHHSCISNGRRFVHAATKAVASDMTRF